MTLLFIPLVLNEKMQIRTMENSNMTYDVYLTIKHSRFSRIGNFYNQLPKI